VLAALGTAWLALRPRQAGDRVIGAVLALLWFWMGAVYHLAFFAAINPAAKLFGGIFLLQGLLFALAAVRGTLAFGARRDVHGWLGALFMLYALVLYPAAGLLVGHVYPASPTFGAPCPTTIFTFGLLLWASTRVPGQILVVPFLWSLLGISAALSFGVLEDLALPIVALVASGLLLRRNRRLAAAAPAPRAAVADGPPAAATPRGPAA